MENLKRELTVDLPKELERARAHGDLSENAEWAMAKQRQEFLRARLSNYEVRIAELARINLDSVPRDTVGLGSKVEIEEVDASLNRISLASPLGKAMLSRGEGDDVEVQTPKGKRSYVVKRLLTIHDLLASGNGNGGEKS
jgi:transcription elongation factor GreA